MASGFEIWRRYGFKTANGWLFDGIGYGAKQTLSAPLERVKLLLQAQSSIIAISDRKFKPFAGIVDCCVRTWKEQGLTSFWRGNLADILHFIGGKAVGLIFKDITVYVFPVLNTDDFRGLSNLVSSFVVGGLSLLLTYPFQFVQTRLCLDVSKGEFSGICDCLAAIAGKGGVLALYTGLWTSVVGSILHRLTYFSLYPVLRSCISPKDGSAPALLPLFAVGQAAALAACLASIPCNIVRFRLILQAGRAAPPYRGALHCLVTVAREEGLGALFAGAGLTVGSAFLGSLILLAYDALSKK